MKIIIITFTRKKSGLRKRLKKAGIDVNDIGIYSYQGGDEDICHSISIREQKPGIIIFDGTIFLPIIELLYEEMRTMIETFHIPCNFFTINKSIQVNGIGYIDKIPKIEELRTSEF